MSSRQIHNYESKILKEETIEKYGYDPDNLGKTSSKFVVAICRVCGKAHDIRKGFFNKTGSACHKECKIIEMRQQKSPFSDPKIRKKAKNKIKEKYGSEYASQNKEIAKKISKVRSSKESQERTKKTNLERYGVENPFQSEEIKEKIRQSNIEKYGVDHPQQNRDIQNKTKQTNLERYGYDNPLKDRDSMKEKMLKKYGVNNPQKCKNIRDKTRSSFGETVKKDSSGKYKIINILRGEEFWNKIKDNALKNVCLEYNIDYQTVTSALLRDEFKNKYYETYLFPTQQKQKEIYDWLKKEGANVVMNDRSVISPLELDIVDHDKKVAIEFNGSFWHSEANLSHEEARVKHINKTKLCNEQGYRLIHIFEHTYLQREKQVKNYLRSAFGLNKNKIAGRKCSINHENSDKFIDDYHIQGAPNGTIKYFNLIYDGEIVGVMTAGKHHEKGGDRSACILTRLVFKENCTVQGGASKLFKYFKKWAKESGYDQIISWSDNIFSEGDVYSVLGFDLEEEYAQSYFYYDQNEKKYKTKQSQRKTNKQRPKDMTIVEWNNSRGVYAIWDCGKKKWSYNLKDTVFCKDTEILQIIDSIKNNLTFELVKKEYRGKTPLHGSCYVATEALYYLIKDKYDIVIKRYKLNNGINHWWLEVEGQIVDVTKEQFDFDVPYYLGRRASFRTNKIKKPSDRCQKLLNKIEIGGKDDEL